MSFWTDVRDTATYIGSAGLYDAKKMRKTDKEQRNMINAQIKAYQDQTALARQQLDEARAATSAEKRRVNEKQIRSLRRTSRAQSAGLLGVGQAATQDTSSQLGG